VFGGLWTIIVYINAPYPYPKREGYDGTSYDIFGYFVVNFFEFEEKLEVV
jgi:hypothetical protein